MIKRPLRTFTKGLKENYMSHPDPTKIYDEEKEPTPSKGLVPNNQSLARQNGVVEFDPEKQVQQATIAAKALMTVVSQKSKKVQFNGEQYLEFEDWQTIAQFYNHTVGIEWTKPIEEAGKIIGFEAKAALYNRDGIIVGGSEAACMTDEPNWSKKPKFQLRSMAQTRAMAKALRSRFGFVAVLAGFKPTPAEEMQDVFDKKVSTPDAEYFCETHDRPLVIQPAGVSKQGKAYKAFWKCEEKVDGKFCKGPFINTDGVRVRQNPETGEMMPDQQIEVLPPESESSIDKARRILDTKVPQRGDYPA